MSSILAFFILICVLVFVHEYGHFWAARKCGVKVHRFSIGFGKVLFRKMDRYGTEFAFSLIPLGGYVQMASKTDDISKADEVLENKTVLQRIFIVIAGPAANFLFAILAYWAVFMGGISSIKPVIGEIIPDTIVAQAQLPAEFEIKQIGNRQVRDWEETTLALMGNVGKKEVEITGSIIDEDFPQTFKLDLSNWDIDANKQNPLTSLGIRPKSAKVLPKIRHVVKGGAAEKAGVNVGDEILAVDQQPFNWQELLQKTQTGQALTLTLKQDAQVQEITLIPEKSEKEGRYLIGIAPEYEVLTDKYRIELKYDILTAFWKSLEKVIHLTETIIQFIGNLISGDLSLKNMGGPVAMAKGAGATAEIGWLYYLGFMALISVNLGVMNLFPLLPLDGGRLLLLLGEGIIRKPLPERFETIFQQVGMALVLGLMFFALFNDIINF